MAKLTVWRWVAQGELVIQYGRKVDLMRGIANAKAGNTKIVVKRSCDGD